MMPLSHYWSTVTANASRPVLGSKKVGDCWSNPDVCDMNDVIRSLEEEIIVLKFKTLFKKHKTNAYEYLVSCLLIWCIFLYKSFSLKNGEMSVKVHF